ncbi:hypothetical protein M0M57_04150 [Flavobacterium azooxidireducens]|uniref:Uncharacterized protein n=1 Tax=Flavobacterium azooxidireducens TaxID=1871076 RepID=A0ABN0PQV4_9FLAO|nr:hypothetical protein [Flavobacterium azooxidireducens]UPQ80032.1 hypothetical protein M0M57_04150 [Flavobacterium azooxidireducens]
MNKFYLILTLVLAGFLHPVFAQVGVGTTTPQGALDVNSTTNGMLIPRVTLTSAIVANPVVNPQGGALQNGTLVYNTATNGTAPNNVVPGFYYWLTNRWVAIGGSIPAPTDAWAISGNAGTNSGTNFVGTTDNVDLHFRTNGSNKFRLPSASNQILGYGGSSASPTYSWDGGTDTGMWLQGANTIRFSTGGTARFQIPNEFQVHAMNRGTALLPFYSFSADANTGLFSPSADNLGLSTNGGERVRITNTAVGIGVTTPNAALDVTSTTSGFIAPRIILTATNVAAPVVNPNGGGAPLAGTIVYNTATAGTAPNNVTPGYYYWDGARWVRMEGGATASAHNTLDLAYDEGGAGAGRAIVADAGSVLISGNNSDSGLQIINNSTASGVSGQYNSVINNGTIAYVADVNADGVGVLIDHNDTNNPYSGLQVTTLSNNTNSAGIYASSVGTSSALAIEGGFGGTSTIDAMTSTNFRTNGGAAIDALGAIGIRSTSQVNGGSAYSGYLNATQGTAGQFNGAGTGSLTPSSLFTGNQRYGLVSQGTLVGTNSSFTGTVGAAFEGVMSYYGYNILFSTAIAFNDLWDIYFRSSQPNSNKTLIANVIGPGVNATTIKKDDKTFVMPAVSAPESLFQDYGTGRLINGRAQIKIDEILSDNILVDERHPLKVFIQLEGECNGVYVTNKSAKGFDVIELANGNSNVEFSYSLVATRASVKITKEDGSQSELNYSARYMNIDAEPTTIPLIEDKGSDRTNPIKKLNQSKKEIESKK